MEKSLVRVATTATELRQEDSSFLPVVTEDSKVMELDFIISVRLVPFSLSPHHTVQINGQNEA